MEKCIIHFEQVSEEHLVELKDRASWETLLNAAKIRKFEPIIEIDKNLGESDIPAIKYHRKCRSLFTLKRDLQKLNSENDKTLLSTSSNIRSSNRNSTSLQRRECEKLPFNCIFCQSTKRIKGTETKEKLNLCVELRADKLIKEASLLQNDPRIVALCTDDLIAKEAAYHKSCYRDFTRIVTAKKSEAIEQENEEELDISFDAVEDFIKDLIENPDIAEYKLLTDIFEEELRKSNMTDEYIKNAKKNLRRKIERNIPNVNFINVRRKLFIYPDSLSKTDIITIYLENKFELDNLKSKSNSEKGIVSSALMIREKIKLLKDTMPWPPNVNDLDTSKINITDYLGLFLNTLLSGSSMESSSSKVNRLKLSIGQDLVYAISNGRIKTPKSILYPYAIKSLTNSTKLITINNQLGHGISASILEELATENAFRVLENQLENSVLLHGVSTEVFTMTVHDNIDRNEETLSGAGTTHRVNGIVIQPGKFTETSYSNYEPKKKRSRRSFQLPSLSSGEEYLARKRIGPEQLQCPDNEEKSFMFGNQERMRLSWILSRKEDINYVVPSWTGFNILIRNEMPILHSNIQYLTSIDSPATEMSTVITVLDRCLKIKEQLRLNYIVCVFDQAIYCKAMELKWRYPDKYKDCIIMLGIFHMIMMYLGIIGKKFSDAGLRDLILQSDVVATGSVDKALSGKMYNRSVRAHKLVYEALYRSLLSRMEDSNTEDSQLASTISDIQDKVNKFSEEITQNSHDEFIESDCFEQLNNAVIDYKQYLESTSDLAKFWLSYLSMVELLLNTLYATRTGNWDLLLECIRDIARYAFAYDNYNYARYLTPWLSEMLNLETSHPEVYQEFQKGNFSVQLSETNPFGRCEPDKVIETTINKDTKTPGGLTGFSTKTNAVDRWTINASYRASLYSHLQEFLGANTKKYVHTDLQKSRIRKDQDDVTSMLEILEECFIDPFSENPLLSISNGILATEKLVSDTFNDFKLGTERMDAFIEERCIEKSKDFFDPLKRLNIQTFSKLSKCVTYKCKDKDIPLVANRNLFAKLIIIMQNRSIDLKEVFKYPLGPFPWALAGSVGDLKKPNKTALLHELEKKLDPVEPFPSDYINIIDGMAAVRKLKVNSNVTFKEMSEILLYNILKTSKNASQIHVVFDVYKSDSIKNAERIRRSSGQLQFRNIVASQKIKQWNQFLSSGDNKMQLIDFIVNQWKYDERIKNIDPNIFYATTGSNCYNLSRIGKIEVPGLSTSQEEADTRMFLHARYALNVQGNITINSPDTDVFVLALMVSEKIDGNINFKTGNKNKARIISVSKVKESLKEKYDAVVSVGLESFTKALVSLHAFTGCDTVSAFAGLGKSKAFKVMAKSVEYINLFEKLGENWHLEEKIIRDIEAFVCHLYGYSEMKDVNLLRYKLFCAKKGDCPCVKLPPCQSSLKQHCLRANYQAKIWRDCIADEFFVPSPEGHGWTITDGEISIKWMDCKPAPEEIMELLSCDCKEKCKVGTCTCIDMGMRCTDLCKLQDCDNSENNKEVDDIVSDYETDDDY